MSTVESHRNLKSGLMQTDSTEEDESSSTNDEGLTQAWDTVGAGATNHTHVRESLAKRSVLLCYEVKG